MNAVGSVITGLFNLLVVPFGQSHVLALVFLSLLTGVGMAFVFKWTSNPKAIRAAKDKLKGRILEMRIYQDDPLLIVRAFFGTLRSNLTYLGSLLKPILFLIPPVIIVFMQLDERYARAPLSAGAETVLSVELVEGIDPYETPVRLETNGGVVAATNPVRVSQTNEIDWRLRVDSQGTHAVTLAAGDDRYTIPLVAGEDYRLIGKERTRGLMEPLVHPALPQIPKDSPFARVSLDYPSASYPLFGWDVHWLVIFIVYSLVAALALKFIIKFEI